MEEVLLVSDLFMNNINHIYSNASYDNDYSKQNNQLTSDLKTANSKADKANANLKKVKVEINGKESTEYVCTRCIRTANKEA